MGGWLNGVEYLVSKWKKSFKIRKKGHPPRLFAKLGCFFISVHCDLAVDKLAQLIKCYGGQVLIVSFWQSPPLLFSLAGFKCEAFFPFYSTDAILAIAEAISFLTI